MNSVSAMVDLERAFHASPQDVFWENINEGLLFSPCTIYMVKYTK